MLVPVGCRHQTEVRIPLNWRCFLCDFGSVPAEQNIKKNDYLYSSTTSIKGIFTYASNTRFANARSCAAAR
jgi:hypothetical protein